MCPRQLRCRLDNDVPAPGQRELRNHFSRRASRAQIRAHSKLVQQKARWADAGALVSSETSRLDRVKLGQTLVEDFKTRVHLFLRYGQGGCQGYDIAHRKFEIQSF